MELVPLLRQLVDVDSTTGAERAVGELLAARLGELADGAGGQVERMEVAPDRFNLFAAWGEPHVVLSTHLDTVPPFVPSSEDAEHVHGRGACDAKGSIAAMLGAIATLLAEGRRGFGVLFVVGEETDSLGAQVANRNPRGSRYLIDGEPTDNRLALGSKGALYLAIEAAGRMAHSAYPELGDSAIRKLLAALAAIEAVPRPTDPVLGETTVNVGTIAGGRAPNVVPDRARAEVMIRTVGDTAGLTREIEAAIARAGASLATVREVPAVRLGSLPGFATQVVKFTTDIPRLTAWGEPLLLGPGSIHLAHTPQERVGKSELQEAAELYAALVRRLLSGETPTR